MEREEVQELVRMIQFQTRMSLGDIAAEIGCSRDHLLRIKSKNGLIALGENLNSTFGKEIADFKTHPGKPVNGFSEVGFDTPNRAPEEPRQTIDLTELNYIRRSVFDAHQTLNGLDVTLKRILKSLSELEKLNSVAGKKAPKQNAATTKVVRIKKQKIKSDLRKRQLG